MQTFTKAQKAQLLKNHNDQASEGGIDFKPVVKLFTCVKGNATWLLTEMDEHGIAFGLCDLGLGFAEIGSVDINELTEHLGPFLERDSHFTATKTLSQFTAEAREAGGRIVT